MLQIAASAVTLNSNSTSETKGTSESLRLCSALLCSYLYLCCTRLALRSPPVFPRRVASGLYYHFAWLAPACFCGATIVVSPPLSLRIIGCRDGSYRGADSPGGAFRVIVG